MIRFRMKRWLGTALVWGGLGLWLAGCSSLPKVGDLFARGPKLDPPPAESALAEADSGTLPPSVSTKVYESKSVKSGEAGSEGVGLSGEESWNLPELPKPEAAPAPPVLSNPGTPVPDVNVVGVQPIPPANNSWSTWAPAAAPAAPTFSGEPVAAQMQMTVGGVFRGGSPAPVFAASALSGEQFNLAGLRGKVVLLDFWRKTCGPCLRAMPKVEALRNQMGQEQLVILGINCDERVSTAQAFLKQNPHHWPNIHARSQAANPISLYGVSLLPTFVVIDQIGNIQYRGSSVDAASQKVGELVAAPSVPAMGTDPSMAMAR